MVVEEKAIIGKIKTFPAAIQRLFSLSNQYQCCRNCGQDTILFQPFNCTNCKSTLCGEENVSERKFVRVRSLSQTYPQWKVMCDVQKLHSLRFRKRWKNRVIYILPMGTIREKKVVDSLLSLHTDMNERNKDKPSNNLFSFVFKFASLFFHGMEVKFLSFQDIESLGFTTRIHERTNQKQVLVSEILEYLKKIRPSDSFGIIGWSSLDLYPCSELNFVLGEADFGSGCAVISFGHYANVANKNVLNSRTKPLSDHYCENTITTTDVTPASSTGQCESSLWDCTNSEDTAFWRVPKVITHEVCHLFGMHHCTFFNCLMNESSDVSQAQDQPAFLCPICLRKLQKFLKFPVIERYEMMKDFMQHYLDFFQEQTQSMVLRQPHDNFKTGYSNTMDVNLQETEKRKKSLFCDNWKRFSDSLQWLHEVLRFLNSL